MNIRKSVLSIFAIIYHVFVMKNNFVEALHKIHPNFQSLRAVQPNQLDRPAFHFQPPKHWINGPMYYNGVYHFFYQYNPKGAIWGNIVWAHSVSTDMINWKALKPALYPSKPFDINGCWSGSATILPGNKPIILYTGVDTNNQQVQNFAIPKNASDPYLIEWTKPDQNPLLIAEMGVNKSAFRDPTTAWKGIDGHWRILVGGKRKERGIAHLYRSKDFLKWVKAKHPLHSSADTGMWECPDFYPVSLNGKEGLDPSSVGNEEKYVLKVSLDETRYEYYTIGDYIKEIDMYMPHDTMVDGWLGLRYDYGNFYASKSFFDSGKNRRILWGWANESDTTKEDVQKGWAGIQTIPRLVWLDSSRKQLVQWPIPELETLRGHQVEMMNHNLKKGDHLQIKGITAAQADVDVTFAFSSIEKAEKYDPRWVDPQLLCSHKGSNVHGGVGPFGLLTLASENLEEYTPVFFRIFRAEHNRSKVLMCSDARSCSTDKGVYKPSFAGFVDVNLADGEISLRTLIDNSVVESFGGGGKTCITSRVYPTLAVREAAHLFAFNYGIQTVTIKNLKAWSMNSPKMNEGEI